MKVLDLFSGAGGFSLGLEAAGMETVAFCEFEEWPQKVLRRHWPDVPIYPDVRELSYEQLEQDGVVGNTYQRQQSGRINESTDQGSAAASPEGTLHTGNPSVRGGVYEQLRKDGLVANAPGKFDCPPGDQGNDMQRKESPGESGRTCNASKISGGGIDLICGGFPCQPFSVAGQQRAQEDDRHLWPEMFRLIRECQPTWVIGENVAGLINLGLDEVCADLESADYAVQPFVIPACAVGAPHRRDRVWIVAYNGHAKSQRWKESQKADHRGGGSRSQARGIASPPCLNVSKDYSIRSQRQGWPKRCGDSAKAEDWQKHRAVNDSRRPARPRMGGRLDGLPETLAGLREAWLDETWEDGHQRVSAGTKDRKNRLKALGNAVVPQVVQVIGEAILESANVN